MERRRLCLWATLAALAGAPLACASTRAATSERQADGTIRLQCKGPLPACLERAEALCFGNRYTVLAAVDQHDYWVGGSTGASESRSSRALIRCGARGRPPFAPAEDPLPSPAVEKSDADKPAAATATPPARACVPGATQKCTGPAACAGGQACLADGSGYSACDCGTAPAASEKAPASTP
jgi:hypothetical protein